MKFKIGDVVKGTNSFGLKYIVKSIIDDYTVEVVYFDSEDDKYMCGGKMFWNFYLYEADVDNLTKEQ